jgi:hypothetical protein
LHSAIDEKNTQTPFTSINNCSLLNSKSINLCLSSSYYDYNVLSDYESQHAYLREGTFAIVFFPYQITLMKKLLWEAQDKEEKFTPKMAALGERTTL